MLGAMEQQGEVSKDSEGRYQSNRSSVQGESSPRLITGIAIRESKRWFLQPIAHSGLARIPLDPVRNLSVGDVVSIDLEDRTSKTRGASIQHFIKADSESERATLAVLHAYEVPHDEVKTTDSISIPNSVDSESMTNREDLRCLPFITIDGESAKDFDDAVFADSEREGMWRLRVAIADVAHYVSHGDAIDSSARTRGNSVYLSDRVIPMLPDPLSSGICSLKPNEDRLAVVCDMVITQDGSVNSYSFYEAVIRSTARLTYADAFRICNGKPTSHSSAVIRTLNELYEVATALREARDLRGALDFTTRECTVKVENGVPVDVLVHERNDAHNMIEEAMIAANVCAAEFLLEHKTSALFRVHQGPDAKSLSELRWNLNDSSALQGNLSNKQPIFFKQLLDRIRSQSHTPWIWELQVLRSMKQAEYSFDNKGHFGLALEDYVHFTSPIRRYSDLYIHRLIKGLLSSNAASESMTGLDSNLGNHLSFCERRSVEVTRKVDAWLKCALLKNEIGTIFVGHIVKIEDFGLFVELERYLISGLVHVSELVDDFYENRNTELVGEATGTTYGLGDSMKVRLVAVDVEQQRLDLVDATQSEIRHEYRKGRLKFRRERRKRR